MNDFTFTHDAMAEFMDWIAKDKKTPNKIYSLIEDIRRSGAMQEIGKPEMKLTNCRILRLYHVEGTMMNSFQCTPWQRGLGVG